MHGSLASRPSFWEFFCNLIHNQTRENSGGNEEPRELSCIERLKGREKEEGEIQRAEVWWILYHKGRTIQAQQVT